ncbi:aminoglycoside phosphotransferase (APT) family kinase protein [Arthrobacter sp. CAN_A214]|uniref:aminoglycoside phosphotransferase family protein n=1 Tax=Arthrobacter sp. CAN_A214 TaxID=2787720 RepID=UPI0018CAD700
MPATPAADYTVTAALVRGLLEEQHPDLASLGLRFAGSGWDNVLFRLGDELVVRLPRRSMGADLIRSEQRWLPELGGHLPVATSSPVRVGVPSSLYPCPWSIARWIEGRVGCTVTPAGRNGAARQVAEFLLAFQQPAPGDAPVSPGGRGGPLAARDAVVRARLDAGLPAAAPPAGEMLALWGELAGVPVWSGRSLWLHGDLHAGNLVLGPAGDLRGVVDFGDLCSGDPATDLAAAWLVFDAAGRRVFRDLLEGARPTDAATWQRARGWALSMGSAMAAGSDDNPEFRALGIASLWGVLEG